MKSRNSPSIDLALAVVGSLIAALGALSAASSLSDLDKAIPSTLAVLTAILGAVQVGLRNFVQAQNVPAEDVVEHLDPSGAEVVAGPANSIVEPGDDVRPATDFVEP